MGQKIFNCHKFVFANLLSTAFAVPILWVLGVCEIPSASADEMPILVPGVTDRHKSASTENPLPVPNAPTSRTTSTQALPPPPGDNSSANIYPGGVTSIPLAPQIVQSATKPGDVKQLENAFIQEMTGRGRRQVTPQPTRAITAQATQHTVTATNQAPLPPILGTSAPTTVPISIGGESEAIGATSQLPTTPGLPPLPNVPYTQDYTAPSNPPQKAPLTPTTPPTASSEAGRPLRTQALRQPVLHFQGVYLTQGSQSGARARVSGLYPLTPQAVVGATLDLTSSGGIFADSRNQGVNINELYLATSLPNYPNLRFAIGQLDLTSYFDRNSFAKDGASQFFNQQFQTNPALSATGIASRPGLLVNWSVTDNIEAKAAVFSSSAKVGDFALDGFAGEVGVRYGNAIIRGTYATDRDAGTRDSYLESYRLSRNSANTIFGPQKGDREESYGINTEVFIPNLSLGLFARYGRYFNRDLNRGAADTYLLGASALDIFTPDDRIGIAYGRGLSNESLRASTDKTPDVLELFYDFKFLPTLRLGFSVQERSGFTDAVFGIRVRTDFDVSPQGRITP